MVEITAFVLTERRQLRVITISSFFNGSEDIRVRRLLTKGLILGKTRLVGNLRLIKLLPRLRNRRSGNGDERRRGRRIINVMSLYYIFFLIYNYLRRRDLKSVFKKSINIIVVVISYGHLS